MNSGGCHVDDHHIAVFDETDFTLSCLSHLRRCHLTFILRDMFVAGNMALPCIESFITQALSTGLEELVVSIKADSMEDLRALDSECGVREVSPVRFDDLHVLNWERISLALDSQSGPVLRTLTFVGQGETGQLRSHLKERYPGLERIFQPRHAQ